MKRYRQIIVWDDVGNFAQPCMTEDERGDWVRYKDARDPDETVRDADKRRQRRPESENAPHD